jgi:hypothetical protein
MRWISIHSGRLCATAISEHKSFDNKYFRTDLSEWNRLAPQQQFARGAIHEILYPRGGVVPTFPALVLAREACKSGGRTGPSGEMSTLVWCDPRRTLHPPSVTRLGILQEKFWVVRVGEPSQLLWCLRECLRCRGIGAVVCPVGRLSSLTARRLQLACEQSNAVGVLLREKSESSVYAADTRWLAHPSPGTRQRSRWWIELVHGHGGRTGEGFYLERDHESDSLHSIPRVEGRPGQEEAA